MAVCRGRGVSNNDYIDDFSGTCQREELSYTSMKANI